MPGIPFAASREEGVLRTNLEQRRKLWESGFVYPSLFGVRADNLTPMTVSGTNTFIIHTPGTDKALVVDPGPPDVRHLTAVMDACEQRGAQVAGIFITHTHADHIGGTDLFLHLLEHGKDSVDPDNIPEELNGDRYLPIMFGHRAKASFGETFVPVYASDLGNCPEGEFAPFEGLPRLSLIALPGHSDDTVGIVMHEEKAAITGDQIFRFWSSVVPYGDGNVGDYLDSLDKLQNLVRTGEVEQIIPAHGFPIDQPIKAIEGYRAHRRERLAHVEQVIDSGAGFDADAVVKGVYGDVDDPLLLRAAYSTTFAQLVYLAKQRGVEFVPNLDRISQQPVLW